MTAPKSKTLATWLALLFGTFGAHRFYLRGARDLWAWLHALPTLAGAYGIARVQALGQDDRLSWLLLPLLGLMLAQACAFAIVYGLTSDAAWAERHRQALVETRWGPVLGVIAALMIGAAALMAAIAFGSQRFFEWRMDTPRSGFAAPTPGGRDPRLQADLRRLRRASRFSRGALCDALPNRPRPG